MSRIHDALKKAELEQSPYPLDGAGTTATRIDEPEDAGISPIVSTMPPPALPFTFETLLERCPAGRWSPDRVTMLFFDQKETLALETFRTLRSRLFMIREKTPLKKIMVTSSMGDEGKSFVAANLAQVLVQQHGQRALLIDADLRRPQLHSALGTSATPGLSDYLMGTSEELAVLQRGPIENLFFLPAGIAVPNPLEQNAKNRLTLLLNRMEQLFDWIILDSSPAIQVSDAGQIANSCDGVLLVVRSNATPFDLAQKARDEFYRKKIVGVVLNGVDANSVSPVYNRDNLGRS